MLIGAAGRRPVSLIASPASRAEREASAPSLGPLSSPAVSGALRYDAFVVSITLSNWSAVKGLASMLSGSRSRAASRRSFAETSTTLCRARTSGLARNCS